MNDLRILFLTHPYPNFVPDLLLHGLRKILGPGVVDFPKKESRCRGELLGVCPEDQRCPNLFADDARIDRHDIAGKTASGYFSYVICDIRALITLRSISSQWPRGLVLVDGEDSPAKIQPGPYAICRRETDGSDLSIPLPMALPEEILCWIAAHDHEEKSYSVGFAGSVTPLCAERAVVAERIAQWYPDCFIRTSALPSRQVPSPPGRLGRDEYYRNLQRCKVVLTLRGAGCDTFRFWENAACNAVHVSQKMPLHIPDDFVEGRHILRFASVE